MSIARCNLEGCLLVFFSLTIVPSYLLSFSGPLMPAFLFARISLGRGGGGVNKEKRCNINTSVSFVHTYLFLAIGLVRKWRWCSAVNFALLAHSFAQKKTAAIQNLLFPLNACTQEIWVCNSISENMCIKLPVTPKNK